MSKLVETYSKLKEDNPNTILLFKQGIFFIVLTDDAQKLSNSFGFKLTYLNSETLKCGFPCSNIDKYLNKFNNMNLEIRIIDSNTLYKPNEYSINNNIKKIIEKIKKINVDTLSISESYEFIEELQKEVNKIIL